MQKNSKFTKCPHCSHTVKTTMEKCLNCGEIINTKQEKTNEPTQKKANKRKEKIAPKKKMYTCKGCDNQISKNAKVCPYCGEPGKKKTHWFTWLMLFLFIAWFFNTKVGMKATPDLKGTSTHSEKVEKCSKSDFKITKGREWRDGDYYKIAYQVKNNCNYAYAPQLQINYYGNDDAIINSSNLWPASISNIPAHSSYGHKYLARVSEKVSSVEIKVIKIREWK